ncbi:hypothetical protein BCR34DRAFT_51722 [Clohesyomyces aquaticus]|uniref:Aspartic peptidase domain-containing protein n=1 Tax=Clohesyomyces aquaticus TaxID=1231657 RepID=A0A1Y2A453_9PLEO|nr:hypothetical protein BCR34DRAFT_51722 [Clohesyomyces aquaticus]
MAKVLSKVWSRCMLTTCVCVVLSLLRLPVSEAACQPRPQSLPISHQEGAAGSAGTRGIRLAIGTEIKLDGTPKSGVDVSFLPSVYYNQTYVFGEQDASNFGSYGYANAWRGGYYQPKNSSTSNLASTPFPLTTVTGQPPACEEPRRAETSAWYQDTVYFGSDLPPANFTFGIPRKDIDGDHDFIPAAQLGLGSNSSFLRLIKERGHVVTRVYSIFWGRSFGTASEVTDGSLMLGGFDESIINDTATNLTAPIVMKDTRTQGCNTGMLVTITQMTLNWPNNTDTTVFGNQNSLFALEACIIPGYQGVMTLPNDYWEAIRNLMGGQVVKTKDGGDFRTGGVYIGDPVYDPHGLFYGDLTLSIRGTSNKDIDIRVLNTELVTIDPYITPSGIQDGHGANRTILLNGLPSSSKDTPVLGRIFLSSAYLMVNHDQSEFTVWPVSKNPKLGSKTNGIRAVDGKGVVSQEFCGTGTNGTSNPGSSPSPSSSSLPTGGNLDRKLSTGGVVGLAIGAVAAISFVIGAACVYWKRRKSNAKSNIHEIGSDDLGWVRDTKVQARAYVVPVEIAAGERVAELEGRAIGM